MKRVLSDMPGVVQQVLVAPDEQILRDQDIVMVESMKMLLPVPSTVNGTVRAILVRQGDVIEKGTALIEVEE